MKNMRRTADGGFMYIHDFKIGFQKKWLFTYYHEYYDGQYHIIWIGCFYIKWMGSPWLDM